MSETMRLNNAILLSEPKLVAFLVIGEEEGEQDYVIGTAVAEFDANVTYKSEGYDTKDRSYIVVLDTCCADGGPAVYTPSVEECVDPESI